MLSPEQRQRIEAEANQRGIDPAKLIAAAEEELGGEKPDKATSKPGDKSAGPAVPPLYMYHLPFVTVNEVRERWLGLGPVAGGDEYAAKFAAAQAPSAGKPSTDDAA
jgi:hypothetical protein